MTEPLAVLPATRPATCVHEADFTSSLLRRSQAEALGTLLLMCLLTALGPTTLAAFPREPVTTLLGGAVAGASALVSLVIAFGALFGGHFNPLITALQWLGRERSGRCTLAYVAAQTGGAALGAWLVAVGLAIPRAFVNPALTVGALLAAEPHALGAPDAWHHVVSQSAGALLCGGVATLAAVASQATGPEARYAAPMLVQGP